TRGHTDGAVCLRTNSFTCAVLHGDLFAGMPDTERQRLPAGVTIQLLADELFAANENHSDVERLRCIECAFDFRFREVVASHCVEGYGDHLQECIYRAR